MKRTKGSRRRTAIHITLPRAARLHRLVRTLGQISPERDELLTRMGLGLRTFYRELELLRRVGVRVRLVQKRYVLVGTAEEALGKLPFPDPQLTFAEMAELSRCPGPTAQRLAELLERVTREAPSPRPRKPRGRTK
jgi:hypothetical protein